MFRGQGPQRRAPRPNASSRRVYQRRGIICVGRSPSSSFGGVPTIRSPCCVPPKAGGGGGIGIPAPFVSSSSNVTAAGGGGGENRGGGGVERSTLPTIIVFSL